MAVKMRLKGQHKKHRKAKRESPINFADFITIKEAAELFGVTQATLRNWDKAGKFKPIRSSKSGYRLYNRAEILKELNEVKKKQVF